MRNLTLILLLFASLSASAQKLPNKQEKSIWAPANIKIDGKADEWSGKLQAYNRATSLFYTMSNDNNNLYLIVQSDDFDALSKITNTGIVLNLKSATKKNDQITIIYPFFEKNSKPFINFRSWPKIDPHSPASKSKADSFMVASNKRLDQKSKYLKILGLPEVDTLISIYNELGLKTREAFDNQMKYTYELAVPLIYLKKVLNFNSTFNYHISLPGLTLNDFGVERKVVDGVPEFNFSAGATVPPKNHLQATFATTDFSGEYTLAKAP